MTRSRILACAVLAALPLVAAGQSAPATGAAMTPEERTQALEKLVREQDARIRELERLLGVKTAPPAGATAATPAAGAAPAVVAEPAAGAATGAAASPAAAVDTAPATPPPRRELPTPRGETWGVYDPGTGFVVGRSEFGELDLSAYAMGRLLSQEDEDQVFVDHLGNTREVDPRNDVFSHRVIVFLKGWVGDPKLVYTIFLWTVNATDQDAIFGNLGYQFNRHFNLYAGLAGNPGSRSLLGSHPYWLAHDRVMADEFFRPYFGSGVWANGEIVPGLWYAAMFSNNSSALGVKASQLDRAYTTGGSLWWMPTTQEFGPRGAYGDWEYHDRVATRFGVSTTVSPEQSFSDSSGNNPQNTTLRLADSVNVFEPGALAPGVTVDKVDYRVVAADAGVKYKGMFLQAEFYQRRLDNFIANGALPVGKIVDKGFYVQAAFFPIPKTLEVYGVTSQIYGDKDAGFGNSSEYGLGANWYPFPTRDIRWNLQLLDVNRSPVSSTFGYYTGGQDGFTAATSFSVFF